MDKDKELNLDTIHWADNYAEKLVKEFPDKEVYVVASGISPSGIIHAGHFREIITTELVRRSLEKRGKRTKFIYSWDSYDVFRKVPKNIPEEWEKYLRLPVSTVPDPWKCHNSFAEHWMQQAETILKVFHFPIEFQRQHILQTSGIYAADIKKSLQNKEKIRSILDQYRSHLLSKDWFPLSVYCEKCGKDTTTVRNYDGEYSLDYKCQCGFQNRINFKETPIVKLSWRLDWPMRWNFYDVVYEPGGKDHSTPGSSYDTGKEIVKLVFNRKPPIYTAYNFIKMKGLGGKISSSKGKGATLQDFLEIYTPEMMIFLFAMKLPNSEMDISFDLDVLKIYEDFDKIERIYYGVEKIENLKKLTKLKRVYELSMVGDFLVPQKTMPFQPSFRHLLNISQSQNFNFEKVKEFYSREIKTDYDLNRLKERFKCCKNWLEMYAPETMKFVIKEKQDIKLEGLEKKIIKEIIPLIQTEEEFKNLIGNFKDVIQKYDYNLKDFFVLLYKLIIGKDKGPRIINIIIDNKRKVLELLNDSI